MFKKLGSKLAYIIAGILLAIAGTVYAVNVTVPQSTALGQLLTGQTSGNWKLLSPGSDGLVLTASSTSANGLAWQTASSTGGSGITSLNGLVGSTQTFATTVSGSIFNVTSAGSTHTFTFPNNLLSTTTAASTYYLQSNPSSYIALTNLSGTAPISYNNGTGVFSCPTCVTNSYASTTFVTAVTGSGNIASSGGLTPNITFTGQLPVANGGTGSSSLNTTLVAEGNNLYFTNARAAGAISLTTTGSSGAATYNNSTGALNIPTYSGGGSLPYGGQQGLFLGNTASGTSAWLTPAYVSVCASGCNYTASGTNDQIGINAAIAAVNAAGGGTVYIKAGNYNTTVGQNLTASSASNIDIIGDGPATVINLSNSSQWNITSSNHIKIADLRMTSVNGNHDLVLGNSQNIYVENDYLSVGTPAFVIYADSNDSSYDSNIYILNNYLVGAGKQDVIGGGPGTSDASSTINSNMVIEGNIIVQQTFAGGVIDSGMDVNCMDVTGVTNLTFSDNLCYGDIVLGNERYPDKNSTISNNVISAPIGPVYASGQIWLGQDGNASGAAATPQNLTISGNTITDGNIYMYAGSSNLWQSLQITNNNITVASTTAARTTQAQNGQGYNCIRLEYANNANVSNNICNGQNDGSSDGVAMNHDTNSNISNNRITNFWNGYNFYNGLTGDQAYDNIVNNASTSTTSILPITQFTTTGLYGINTTTPNATLHVEGLAGTNNLFQLSSSSGTSLLTVDQSGNLTVVASSTLATTTVTQINVTNLTVSGNTKLTGLSNGCVNITSGLLGSTTCGGGGSVSGGLTGLVATWASSTALTYGTLMDNGTVSGVNATSSTVNFNIQGSGILNPLIVASSSGVAILTVASSSKVGIGTITPTSTLFVQGLTGNINPFIVASSSGASMLTVSPTGAITSTAGLTINGNLGFTGASGCSLNQSSAGKAYLSGGCNWGVNESNPTNAMQINGTLAMHSGGSEQITLDRNATSNTGTFIFSTNFSGGYGLQTSGTNSFNLYDNTNAQSRLFILNTGLMGIGTTTPLSVLHIESYNNSSTTVPLIIQATSSAATNLAVLNIENGAGTTLFSVNTEGDMNTIGTSTLATTTITALTVTGIPTLSGVSNCSGSQYLQISSGLFGCGTPSGGSGTISTSTNVNIGHEADWTGLATLGNGIILDNGTVAGITATSSLTNFNIQGTGTLNPFNVASSSGTSLLSVLGNGNVGIGTTTQQALLTLQGSSGSNKDLFDVASSTGALLLQVLNSSQTILSVGTTSIASNLIVQGSTSFPTEPLFILASSSGSTVMEIDSYGHLITGGVAPTCGTGCASVTGDDHTMRVVTGSGVTSITVNFAHTYTDTPVCIATDESGGTTTTFASSTPTTVVIQSGASLTTKNIGVMCQISSSFAQ